MLIPCEAIKKRRKIDNKILENFDDELQL